MVENNQFENRFEAKVNGVVALLEYRLRGEVLQFLHTEVPQPAEGQGIGGQLARAGLEYARENGWKVAPLCSFVAGYIKRHPEYLDLVAEPYKARVS